MKIILFIQKILSVCFPFYRESLCLKLSDEQRKYINNLYDKFDIPEEIYIALKYELRTSRCLLSDTIRGAFVLALLITIILIFINNILYLR